MKRFFVILIVLTSIFALAACEGGLGKDSKRVSEYRDNVFTSTSDAFKSVKAVTGYREAPFVIDGVSGEKANFTVVTIEPVDFDADRAYTYKTAIGGVEYEGEMVKHPFENSFSFEVNAHVTEQTFTVYVGDEEVTLTSVKGEDFITPEKAYEIARKRLSAKDGEIYIRIIENPVNASGGYFWYVAFVDKDKNTHAVLIEPVTMEIAAVRE